MIVGRVLATGEAVIDITVRGPSGQKAREDAMVDTGFSDHLTLPGWVIEKLGLPLKGEESYVLGDGVRQGTRIYRGEIEWEGGWREVMIVELEHDALFGAGAMMGCNLNIDLIEGGRVEIKPLTSGNV